MSPSTAAPRLAPDPQAMRDLLRDLLSDYVDLSGHVVDDATELAALGVDSLTLAEVLFALEDRLGVRMDDPVEMPRTVGEVIAYATPYLRARSADALH